MGNGEQDGQDSTQHFVETLDKLADFQDYFTDPTKVERLVDWLHEETGFNKPVIRLAVKRVAPFVLARLEKLGKRVGAAWLARLHERLGRYDWYYGLAQALLRVLQTRTDDALGKALAIPANDNLEALITDRTRWDNLKPEQQGLVQLLLGQNQLSEGQSVLQDQLDRIIRSLAFDLDLKTPDFITGEATDAARGSAQWLTYAARQVPLIGREAMLEQLDSFFDQDAILSWWLISGPGGVGKSRLALEAALRRQLLWETGFLDSAKLDKPDALANWEPAAPTLIVIDYAARHAEAIAQWLDHLIRHEADYAFPVRLLLLEREYREQDWWKTLLPPETAGDRRRNRLFSREPWKLAPLSKDQLPQLLRHFLNALGRSDIKVPDDAEFVAHLDELSAHGRPLYIGMAAIAVADQGAVGQLRNWRREDLLKRLLDREQMTWLRQLATLTQDQQRRVIDLLAVNTMVDGLDEENEQVWARLTDSPLIKQDSELENFWQALTTLTGNPKCTLQPDIFAEYFLLQQWPAKPGPARAREKQLILFSYTLSPRNTLITISRCAIDYTQDPTAFRWWTWLRETADNDTAKPLYEQALDIVGEISLHGQYQIALERWLPAMQDVEDQRLRARVLNLTGLQCHYTGQTDKALSLYQNALEIFREIGDRAGEGATLNNISHILYTEHHEYGTALDYLKQALNILREIGDHSGEGITLNTIAGIYRELEYHDIALNYLHQALAIHRKIGDRAGEGTTLNNISQIYQDQNHLNTAISYLQQSLDIRKEIGDVTGQCVTMFNIGLIYWQNGEKERAFSTWTSVYQLAKPMQLAQILEALAGLAEQLGLPGGLDAWEALAS